MLDKGSLEKVEPTRSHGAVRRPLRRRHRAVAHRPVVSSTPKTLAQPAHRRGARRARRNSSRRTGRTPTSSGCDNIQPWCISRQLWWGHQIPAWYGPRPDEYGPIRRNLRRDDRGEAIAAGRAYYGDDVTSLSRRPTARLTGDACRDSCHATCARRGRPRHLVLVGAVAVLDAGLARARRRSSQRYYPTDVLVTGFDIIFFWVARMMMMGLHFMERGAVPQRLHPRPRPRREAAEDVQVEGQRHRPAGADRRVTAPTRCASRWRRWRRRAATSSSRRSASRATATSPPSSGTPRASSR